MRRVATPISSGSLPRIRGEAHIQMGRIINTLKSKIEMKDKMKKFALIAAIFILVALFCVLVPSLVSAQVAWESYRDPEHTTVWGGSGTEYDVTYYIVYMHAEGSPFVKGVYYNVGYYDGNGDKVAEDLHIKPGPSVVFVSEYDLSADNTAAEGTWHASVYPDATPPPATYGGGTVADDSFLVLQSAIPEFPTVMAGIMVAGLCFGIYYWMRKRKLAYVKA